MSYEIYYDRAYIRVGDQFIPLVNQGSNNYWVYSPSGREVPEKNWQVLNWRHRDKLLFSAAEVREQAAAYEDNHQLNGMSFKTRNVPFASGEFGRWIINGMKNAYTIEDYVSFGNSLFIHDYTNPDMSQWQRHYFRTTAEFLALLEQLNDRPELNLCFGNSREVRRPAKHRPKSPSKDYNQLPEYFVLKFELGYFAKWNRAGGFVYHYHLSGTSVRKFTKEMEAEKFLLKYKERLRLPFTVEKITSESV